MISSYTSGIVAAMQDAQAIRNGSKVNLPRKTMSSLRSAIHLQLTMPKPRQGSGPFPARFGLVHFLPKAINQGYGSDVCALTTAIRVHEVSASWPSLKLN